MKLRFIGKDESMDLFYGEIYDVTIRNTPEYIWVIWDNGVYCPYSSPQAFAENWEAV